VAGLPGLVFHLHGVGQTNELAAVERRQPSADGERVAALGQCQLELAAPRERPHERRMLALAAEPECPGGVGEREVEAGGRGLEPGGHPP